MAEDTNTQARPEFARQRLRIDGPAGALEAALTRSATVVEQGVMVIAHPHPLYGGSMDNVVVKAAARAATSNEFSALRFNFRGVGASEGTHDKGVGEVDDLAAVIAYCRRDLEAQTMLLAGYSFGAATILRLQALPEAVSGVLLIAPPISMHSFSRPPWAEETDESQPVSMALIYGGTDELTASEHREQIDRLNPRSTIEIPDVGHDLGTATGSFAPLAAALAGSLAALASP